jgi:hypothetical protein
MRKRISQRLSPWKIARWSGLASALALYQVGCLPDGSFAQVTAENVIFSFAIAITSITSVVFNTLFGII